MRGGWKELFPAIFPYHLDHRIQILNYFPVREADHPKTIYLQPLRPVIIIFYLV